MVPNTEYNVYIIGGSAHPGYPDLMTNDQIKLIDAKTLFIPTCYFLFSFFLIPNFVLFSISICFFRK